MNAEIRPSANAQSNELPRSFLACLPWVWTRVLFPGRANSGTEPLRWRSLLLLVILPAAVLYPCMSFHLFEPDEGRYAEIPREMLVRGELIVPLLYGKPYLDKPPLLYWLVMLSYSVFGTHDWSARLIPALSVHGCILLVYFLGKRSLGERAAFWGALLLALAHGFEGMARLLLLDGLLTFLVTLALFSVYESVRDRRFRWGWWLTTALACGLGILAKGPVILVLLLPPLWLQRHLTKSALSIPRSAWFAFLVITLAIALPWYIAIGFRLPEFGHYFLWQHNVMRFLQPFDHIEPVWYYLPILLVCMLPGTLLLGPFIHFLLSSKAETAAKRAPELGYFLLAGLWCVFFFSMSGSKLPTYVLPAFPPLLLCLGTFLSSSRWQTARATQVVASGAWLLMVFGNYWLVPWYAEYRSPMNRPHEVWEYCGDTKVPVVCFPRHVDSVAFYLGRDDFRSFRSKYIPQLLQHLQNHERTVVLFSHRHSLELLRNTLPKNLRLVRPTKLGLCDMAVVEKRKTD